MRAVGIVGVGGMGGGLAERLLSEGWPVTLWNRSAEPLRRFEDKPNATVVDTPAMAAATGCVASFVANDDALEGVTLGEDGILAGLPADGIHVSMSSVSPGLIERLAGAHGGRLVAAPVFGRPEAAANGLLWVALSGPAEAVGAARPLLEAVAREIHTFGKDPAAALKVKIAGNFLIASAIEAMTEAFSMLERSGVAPGAFHDMMSATIFGSVIHQNYGRIILDGAFSPPGFKLSLGAKDVGLAKALAASAGADLPFGAVLEDRFATAMAEGLGDLDWNAISKPVRER